MAAKITMKGLLAVVALLAPLAPLAAASCFNLENLVTFGDSLTDEARLEYLSQNNFTYPPTGEMLPERNETAGGGFAWPRFVAKRTGATSLNYAVGGSTCSRKIVTRSIEVMGGPPGMAFPSVLEDQLSLFDADLAFEDKLYGQRTPNNTVYSVGIGPNDLGPMGFMTDDNLPGTTLSDYVDCVWDVFDHIYLSGGRRFVFVNVMAMELAPQYVPLEEGGSGDALTWPDKTAHDVPAQNAKLAQYSSSVNTMFQYGVAFNYAVKQRWPEAVFTILDLNRMLKDVHASPERYLDAPANSTGFYRKCPLDSFDNCGLKEEPRNSFMWYDELHFGERVAEFVADEFIKMMAGSSKYAFTYSS